MPPPLLPSTGTRRKEIVVDATAEPQQANVVVRQSLRDELSASFLPTLLSRNDLQEPTFKEIVVIYRTKAQAEAGVCSRQNAGAQCAPGRYLCFICPLPLPHCPCH